MGTGGAALASLVAGSGGAIRVDTVSGGAPGGAITDNNGAGVNVAFTGGNGSLWLTASGGIGSGNALETAVSTLAASNAIVAGSRWMN